MPKFWKCWASKFHRNLDNEVYFNGSTKQADVAEAFASQFVLCTTILMMLQLQSLNLTINVESLHHMSEVVVTYLGLLMLNLSTSVFEN